MLTPTNETILEKNESRKEAIISASNRFHKSFAEQFIGLNYLAKFGRLFFPILSIGLGVTCLAFLIENAMPFIYACFALSTILLAFLEYGKFFSIKTIFEIYFSGKGIVSWVVGFSLCFHVFSVFLSVQGAKELYEKTDKKTSAIIDNYKAQKDSINKQFDSKISAIQNEVDSVKQSRKVTDWNFAIIKNGVESVQTLENTRTSVLKELKNETKELTEITSKKAGFNVVFFMIIASIIEILIIVCNFFVVFYDYKREKTKEIILKNTGIPDISNIQKQFSDVQFFLSAMQGNQYSGGAKMLNKSISNIKEFSTQPLEISGSYIEKLNNHRELFDILKSLNIFENDYISNELFKSVIAPKNQHLTFKSITLVKQIFDAVKYIGIDKIIENNGLIEVKK